MFIYIFQNFDVFSIVRSRCIKGHLYSFFEFVRHLYNSRTKEALVLKFCLMIVRMFKSISSKFGGLSVVR